MDQDVEYIYDNFNRIQNIKVEGINIRDYSYDSSTGEIHYIKNYTDFTNSDANLAVKFTRVKYDTNKAGLVSGISYFNNNETTPVESYSMTYNSRGFVETENLSTSYAGETANSIQKTHLYDEIGRLLKTTTKENTTDKVTSYSYDFVGNRKTMQDGADSFVYGFDNDFNQLMTVTKNGSSYSTFTYDSNGNQKTEVTDGLTKTFTYDWSDKLVGVKLTKSGYADSNITNFYSTSGQRTRQVVDGITTKYVYDGINLLYTTDDNNIRSNEYVLDTSGAVIAAKRQETKLEGKYDFFNYDIRGSVTGIVGSDGKRIVGYTYDEFGKEKVVGDTNYKNDIMFTGSLFDRSSGMYYMNSRFYNSSAGRFISQDSYKGDVFEPWTQHLYVYTGNNPVNFVDPTGHESRPNPCVNDDGGNRSGGVLLPDKTLGQVMKEQEMKYINL